MKKVLLVIFLFGFSVMNAQFFQHLQDDVEKDTVVYQKNSNFEKQRYFQENLSDKYNGKEFEYKEEVYHEPKKSSSSPIWISILGIVTFFMKFIFPFLLGGFIIFLILKAALGFEPGWFSFKKTASNKTEKLLFDEDADIHETDLEALLQKAIQQEDFRLAVRYYFLILLKELSNKELIDYHKDKTNSEYLFELKKQAQKDQFSYLLYLYNYIWYGEFAINKSEFQLAESKYQSFKKSLQ